MGEITRHRLVWFARFRNVLGALLLAGWFAPAQAVVTCTAPNTNGPAKAGFGAYRFGGGNCSPYAANWVYGTCTWTWNNASVWDAACNSDTVPNVGDDVVIGADSILTMDANRTVRNFTNSGGGNRDAYLTLNNYNLTLTGNFTNNNYPEWNCGALQVSLNSCSVGSICYDTCDGHGWTIFNGSSQQTIGGTSTTSFTNLEINNPAGVKLLGDVFVTGQLKLTSGFIDVNGHKLKIYSDCATYPILGSGYVTDAADAIGGIAWLQLNFKSSGTETCVFPVGDANGQSYITVTKYGSNTGTLMGGSSTVVPNGGAGQNLVIDLSNNVNHLWTLISGASENYWNVASPNASTNVVSHVAVSGLSSATTYDVTMQFCAIPGSCTATEKNGTGNYNVPYFIMVQDKTMASGAAYWTKYLTPTNNSAASTTKQTGVTGFGWFGVGIPLQTLHHVRLSITDGNAAICSAKDITVSMCADAACTPYFPSVSVNLKTPTASAGAAPTWSTNPVATAAYGSGTALTYLSDLTSGAVVSLLTSYNSITVAPTVTTIECWNSTSNTATSCASALTYANCAFDAVEVGNNPGTNIYTKLAGVAFPNGGLDLWATTGGSTKNTTYTGSPTVQLVDDTTGSSCATRTALSGITFSPAVPAAFVGGTLTVVPTSVNAAKKVRVRIIDAGKGITSCSTDSFTIRPTELSVALTNAGNPLVAGQLASAPTATGFTLTATSRNGWTGSASTGNITSGYTGTPTIDWTNAAVTDWNNTALPVVAGALNPSTLVTGGFSAGGGVSATGTYYYDDIGTLTFANVTNAIGDQTFAGPATSDATTSNDRYNGDCDSTAAHGYDNTPTSGKYGCFVGSAVISPLTTNRFRPAYYTAASKVTSTCGGFTYYGQNFDATSILTLTAKSASGTTLSRLNGASLATASAPYAPAYYLTAYDGTAVAPLTTLGLTAAPSTALPLGASPASTWTNGSYTVSNFFITRPTAAPVINYEKFKVALTVNDYDSVRIQAGSCTDGAAAGTITNGAALSGNPAATTVSNCVPPDTGATKVRYGILKLDNVYGSELLPLNVPVTAKYWDGSFWQTNALDSCTRIYKANIGIDGTNPTGLLSSVSILSPASGSYITLSGGTGSIKLDKTGAGTVGTVDLAINLGNSTAQDASCIATGSKQAAYAGAGMTWLQGNGCGGSYAKDPSARVNFGAAKSPYLYRREKY